MRNAVFAVAMVVTGWSAPAWAQTESPRQIQGLIAAGQEQAALAGLSQILAVHPDSGVAWYLTAEAQDASGDEAAARAAFAKAEQIAPGLPFAKPDDVAALRAHLNAGHGGRGLNPLVLVAGAFGVLFLISRLFRRRRYAAGFQPGYGTGYGQPPGGPSPYGAGGGTYPPGTGVGGALLGGLAAGAGFAAGERIIDDLSGNQGGGFGGQAPWTDPGSDPGTVPDRDDGLQGDPGWGGGNAPDDDQNNGGFDPGNNW
jgi:hypothetical protein